MPSRRTLRLVGIILAGTVVAALLLPLTVGMWQGEDGRTFCYPVIGPVQRLQRLRHAALQCRRDGALWHFVRRLATRQRLIAEAEAYCAEANWAVAQGGQARIEYARVQDELRETGWFRRSSDEVLADALAAQCPQLAETAAREEADWNARKPRRRAA